MKKSHSRKKNRSEPGYAARGRGWIEHNGETFLGYGRVVLLERIREYGSITRAARSMEMSYKHAWDLVDSMNRQAPTSLVITKKGGKGGGGAELTEAGEKAVKCFAGFHGRLSAFLATEREKLEF